MDLISVIVPVYNVEKFLARCLNSIIHQTYTNLEIILVNDGSTDLSLGICKEYQQKDTRIKVINQENQGISSARNKGLTVATGEYIIFVDSDDYIKNDMIETMYKTAKNENVEVVVCDFAYKKANGEVKNYYEHEYFYENIYTSDEFLNLLWENDKTNLMLVVTWNKLYQKNIFSDLRFEGRYHEDEALVNKIYKQMFHIAVVNKKLYMYCENSNSIMNANYNEKQLCILQIMYERCQYFRKINHKLYIVTLERFFDYWYLCCLNLKKINNIRAVRKYTFLALKVIKLYYEETKLLIRCVRFLSIIIAPKMYLSVIERLTIKSQV